jgi:spore maturation protein A
MLNYIWLSLLAFGILFGLASDVSDLASNNYHNGEGIPCEIILQNPQSDNTLVKINSDELNMRFSEELTGNISIPINFKEIKLHHNLIWKIPSSAKGKLKDIASATGNSNDISFEVENINKVYDNRFSARLILEDVKFIKMKAITNAAIDYSKTAVDIALGLIGIMAFWLGIMKIAEKAGLVNLIARSVKPITKWLFPEVPPEHPAVTAMIMNISANMLGLGNAATPFGLKAMEELNKLNPEKGIATNAMCTFLAINTAGLTLVPATAIAVRAAQGSSDPTIIIG